MKALSLTVGHSLLVLLDIQERLAAAMPEEPRRRCVDNALRLVHGARLLGVPVLVTEQYPRGLGPTVAPLREALAATDGGAVPIEKVEFDACACAGFAAALERAAGRGAVILAGMEAHICVWQTARGLRARGLEVHVPTDATCSRDPQNRRVAERLWERAGALVTCTETVLFDLLGEAGSETFKHVSRLVR